MLDSIEILLTARSESKLNIALKEQNIQDVIKLPKNTKIVGPDEIPVYRM